MFGNVLVVIANFILEWTGNEPYESGVADLKDAVKKIDDNEEVQKKLIKNFTQQHKLDKRNMANLALAISQKVRAYAYATGNTTLFGEMKFSFAKLFYRNANLAKTLAETIYAAANALSDADKITFNLTAPVLLELRQAIDLYAAVTPRDKIVIRKTATNNFKQLFKDAETILKSNLDNLMGNYQGTEFYHEYQNARLVIGHTIHTTIQGNTVDEETGEDITGVQVLILSDTQQFEDITGPQGKFAQQVSPEIPYTVKFIIPGYEEKELDNITLPRGKHEKLNVKLKKVQPA